MCTLEEDDDFFNELGVMEALEKLEQAAFLKFSMPSFDHGIEFSMSQPQKDAEMVVETEKDVNEEEVLVEAGGHVAEDVAHVAQEAEEDEEDNQPLAKRLKVKTTTEKQWNFRSPYMMRNRRLCKEMSKEEKIVIDYGFSKEVGK
ncbi:unnamed protein product [Cuscuta europaea]|uniref:Uncharacterized protein n=1 Tax=Cuscuta europaea TaxID=41803 RepID=A0A9P1DWC2_CUSEU|nr:unnamed protein product [Cuscuta europaea]